MPFEDNYFIWYLWRPGTRHTSNVKNYIRKCLNLDNRYKQLLVLMVISVYSLSTYSQTVDEIILDPKYYWGEGTSDKRKDAKDIALGNLVSNICVHVSQSSTLNINNRQEQEGQVGTTEEFSSRMSTYSSMTLNNCRTKEVTTKAPYTIFLYIEKAEVEKMFKSRENRVREYVNIANNAFIDMNLADALRYYYSAYLFAHSLMDQAMAKVEDEEGNEQSAMTWIKRRIEEILSNTKPVIMGQNGSESNVYRVGFFIKINQYHVLAILIGMVQVGQNVRNSPLMVRDCLNLCLRSLLKTQK